MERVEFYKNNKWLSYYKEDYDKYSELDENENFLREKDIEEVGYCRFGFEVTDRDLENNYIVLKDEELTEAFKRPVYYLMRKLGSKDGNPIWIVLKYDGEESLDHFCTINCCFFDLLYELSIVADSEKEDLEYQRKNVE